MKAQLHSWPTVMEQLAPEVVLRLLHLARTRAFVLEKVQSVLPHVRIEIDRLVQHTDWFVIISLGWHGLIYPKWISCSETERKDFSRLLCLSKSVDTAMVMEHRLRPTLHRFAYEKIVNSVLRMNTIDGNVDVIRYLCQERGHKFNHECRCIAFLEAESDSVAKFLVEEVNIYPHRDVFLEMMMKKREWWKYTPPDLQPQNVLLTLCMLLMFNVGVVDIGATMYTEKERRAPLNQEELALVPLLCDSWYFNYLCAKGCFPNACKMTSSATGEWRILKYLLSRYDTIPDDIDVKSFLHEAILLGDLEGVYFILDDMQWIPDDLSNYMEDILENEPIARYIIEKLNLYDWDDIYQERFGVESMYENSD